MTTRMVLAKDARADRKSRPLIALLSLPMLVAAFGCSPNQVIKETVMALDTLGRKAEERRSFLGSSTEVFYPNGVPARMADLPQLSDAQLAKVQMDLQRQLNALNVSLQQNSSLMSTALGLPVSNVTIPTLEILQNDAAVAELQPDGTVLLDTRVVQSVYRGVVLSAVEAPDELAQPGSPSEKSQKEALAYIIASRQKFLSASSIGTVNTLGAFKDAYQTGETDPLTLGQNVLNSSLELAGAALMSERASTTYDDALAFVLAHELGHRALGHFKKLSEGVERKTLESEADRFGALLVVLTRNNDVVPRQGFKTPPPGRAWSQSFGGPYCLEDNVNHSPEGHASFFKYGYRFAGFDSLGQTTDNAYRPVAEREALARAVTTASYRAIASAQEGLGNCYPDKKRVARVQKDPESEFKDHMASYEERYAEIDSLKQYGWSDEDIRKRRTDLEDLIAERTLGQSVYVSFVQRMSGGAVRR